MSSFNTPDYNNNRKQQLTIKKATKHSLKRNFSQMNVISILKYKKILQLKSNHYVYKKLDFNFFFVHRTITISNHTHK